MSVTLRPFTEQDYVTYREYAIDVYAREKVEAGNWTAEEAHEKSVQSFVELLPEGLATPNHHLFSLVDAEGTAVGYLWFRVDPVKATAFVFDFEVYAPYQRRGHATAALAALDDRARALGVKRLELHVFGSNTAARSLYGKAGYGETNVQMAKNLG